MYTGEVANNNNIMIFCFSFLMCILDILEAFYKSLKQWIPAWVCNEHQYECTVQPYPTKCISMLFWIHLNILSGMNWE